MTKVQPSSRPGKLPRMRRGMYRPDSIISQAATVLSDARSSEIRRTGSTAPASQSSGSCDWFEFNFPSLGRGHPGPIGIAPHEVARRWPVWHEDHTLWDLAFDAAKGRLAVLRSDPDTAARLNTDGLHVV